MLPQMNRNLNSEELDRGRKKGKQSGRSDNPNSFLFFVLESTKESGGFRFVLDRSRWTSTTCTFAKVGKLLKEFLQKQDIVGSCRRSSLGS
jgi:hypothetical protein